MPGRFTRRPFCPEIQRIHGRTVLSAGIACCGAAIAVELAAHEHTVVCPPGTRPLRLCEVKEQDNEPKDGLHGGSKKKATHGGSIMSMTMFHV
ncbi:hypothetical protein BCR43DRAFT_492746 [Syncephalastrum racemosum]|uniref:Uncharacterized protein n=1 Tax=Syncephalastrum racemosum TaxID=13706 RepID=A0A1X2H9E6_SYNRA|nr:hypothetical protein BCR43DRAFT_492746 [Syncephalastrum racemosum]